MAHWLTQGNVYTQKMMCWNGLVHDQSLRLVVLYHYSWKRYFVSVRLAWGMVPIFHDLSNASGLAHIVSWTKYPVELDALILVAAVLLLARLCVRQIGGYTGDYLGFSQQISEVLIYLAASALWLST